MNLLLPKLAVIVWCVAVMTCAMGQTVPKGYIVPEDTLSPDGRYGVTIPVHDEETGEEPKDAKNRLIDVKTGQVLATIETKFVGWSRMGHGGVLPSRWSSDGTLLLWAVDGKWSLLSLVLLKIEDGKLQWQTDILKEAQKEILARTKKGFPSLYVAIKKRNTPCGEAYPDGFTIDATAMSATGALNSPPHFYVNLTSDPKQIGDFPVLLSNLEASVDWRGKFVVKSFHYGVGTPFRDEEWDLIISSVRHRQILETEN